MLTITACSLLTSSVLSAPPPNYDFQWATVTDPGNAPFPSDPNQTFSRMVGELGGGQVDYNYRISKLEVTTAQWMEFINTFVNNHPIEYDRTFFDGPVVSGGRRVGNSLVGYTWEVHPSVPDAGKRPVGGISWRDAALYANWLHNGKSSDFSSLETGAYDTSTWGFDRDINRYTDDPSHLPGAKFWIPTGSEWIKAAYWDPNKQGPGEGGWWSQPNGTDTQLIAGLPGELGAQTSARFDVFPSAAFAIPLGAYPDSASPWGLLDVSGGAMEWLEPWANEGRWRFLKGQPAGMEFVSETRDNDRIDGGFGWAGPPDQVGAFGLRLASAVPAPTSLLIICAAPLLTSRRRTDVQK